MVTPTASATTVTTPTTVVTSTVTPTVTTPITATSPSDFQERSKILKSAIDMMKTIISPFDPNKQEWTSWLTDFDQAAEDKFIPDFAMTDVLISMLVNAPEYKEYIKQNKQNEESPQISTSIRCYNMEY